MTVLVGFLSLKTFPYLVVAAACQVNQRRGRRPSRNVASEWLLASVINVSLGEWIEASALPLAGDRRQRYSIVDTRYGRDPPWSCAIRLRILEETVEREGLVHAQAVAAAFVA
ncbi:hypothetical protein [Streptomyces sp. NPDC005784]|uniref:hypothetical protein n=1 Tax=Streptomyces sp. NPDC005784 TaxID=3364731 RepID=UPI0036C11C4E